MLRCGQQVGYLKMCIAEIIASTISLIYSFSFAVAYFLQNNATRPKNVQVFREITKHFLQYLHLNINRNNNRLLQHCK